MKANEFVKKFGWEQSIEAVKMMPKSWDYCCLRIPDFEFQKNVSCIADCVDMDDLKRLVESYELVERIGGLDRVKKALDGKHIGYTHFYLHSNDRYVFLDHYVDFIPDHAQHIGMFNKAIADVEACGKVGS